MNATPENPRLLVACDDDAGADPVRRTLQGETSELQVVTDWAALAEAFDGFAPDVLMFAYASLARSQDAQRQLYRQARTVLVQPHRTLVLCHDDEVQAAFDLCRLGHFDDFVPWGPGAHDERRLVMNLRVANRKLVLARPASPTLGELRVHLRHLADVEQMVARLVEGAAGSEEALAARLAAVRAPLAVALAGTRALRERVDAMRPLVLVVDDDTLARALIARALRAQPYDLRFASDGIDAMNQLRRTRPDVILMDVRMPGLDGVSLTQRLKADPQLAPIPVILMTGDVSRETMASSIDVGAAAFLPKPYTRESLTNQLERALGRHAPLR